MFYLLYFLPYLGTLTHSLTALTNPPRLLVMFLLLFAPIPVAVVYEGFRKHRLTLLIGRSMRRVSLPSNSLPLVADRIKRRKALWACFQCIVTNSKHSQIEKVPFVEFFKFVYEKVEMEEEADIIAEVLWLELDSNENGKVNIEEFFNVVDITEQRSSLRLQRVKPFAWWFTLRRYIEKKIDLHVILVSSTYSIVSNLITLCSSIVVIFGLLVEDGTDAATVVSMLDTIFFAFFVSEIVAKILAYGPYEFFDDSWCVFDFTLVAF